jgi:predicted RNA-binding Zn-ribbon protein involved in translation (DUF1610 family)
MNSFNLKEIRKTKIIKTCTKHYQKIIECFACPECGNSMNRFKLGDAYTCEKHS